MKRKRFSEEQIIAILKEAETGVPVKELARHHANPGQNITLGPTAERQGAVASVSRIRVLDSPYSSSQRPHRFPPWLIPTPPSMVQDPLQARKSEGGTSCPPPGQRPASRDPCSSL
jgi:Transposase